ncbi:MAG: DoxX family protein [Methylococcales bacterium]|nr:DoxX family protein [Methylococcales bacterium]
MLTIFNNGLRILNLSTRVDFLAPLILRLYLVPIMWMAGTKKFASFDSTVQWFGNSDWGLGLPFPTLLASLVTSVEILGAIFLLFGFAVRWISIPLFFTMIGAALTVHWKNGWLAIAEPSGFFANERTIEAATRLAKAKEILQTHGNYEWLTEQGSLVILNNGIEFAATYSLMLIVLFFIGAGRYVSVDYWLAQKFIKNE